MKVLVPGYRYGLANFEEEVSYQVVQFIHKEPTGDNRGTMATVSNGTTNEECLKMLIDRLNFLQNKFPCHENVMAIAHIETALLWINRRTADRLKRNVEGKSIK